MYMSRNRGIFLMMAVITCVLAGAVFQITASVIIPFTISVFLAFVLNPIAKFLEKLNIPRIFSILLAVLLIIIALTVVGFVLFASGSTIFGLYPKYEERLIEIYLWVAGMFEIPYDEGLSFFENLWSQLGVRSQVMAFTFSFSNSFLAFLSGTGMVVLFVVFLLIEASTVNEKIEIAFKSERAVQVKKIGADVVQQVTRYLSVKFVISLVTGILVAIGFSLAGLEFAVVWGVIQFLLNFIPFIGTAGIGLAAGLFAILQFWPAPGPIVAVLIAWALPNLILGFILEPKFMGDSLGLSPIAILVALIFWGWIWGFAGAILAVPMMVTTKILCENIPFLEPVSVLLGSRKAALAKEAESHTEDTHIHTEGSNPF